MRALRDVQKQAGAEREAVMAKLLKLEGDLENKKKKVDASRKDLKFKNPESIDQVQCSPEFFLNHPRIIPISATFSLKMCGR